ncbi:MAG: alpha/beta hydrolase [Planctomycetes bacterium]|nr:alpha/beta hydrolase [Planctomycetota bacterium]
MAGHRFTRVALACAWLVVTCLVTGLRAGAESAAGARRSEKREARKEAQRPEAPAPTHADEKYGEHPKQAFDLYLVKSEKPTPLFIWIHGGGFRGGDKRPVDAQMIRRFHEHGVSFASLNYRLTDVGPYPMPMLDAARGLQTIRARARQYNIDPTRIACGGGSAGAGISMWLLYHDDLADPAGADPIARQSTRITCALSVAGQTSYDPRTIQKLFNTDQVHPALVLLYGMRDDKDLTRPELIQLFEDASIINHATRDDPPLYLYYPQANEPLPANSPGNRHIHHPEFGSLLKEKTDKLGLEVVLKLREDYTAGDRNNADVVKDQVDWVLKKFGING